MIPEPYLTHGDGWAFVDDYGTRHTGLTEAQAREQAGWMMDICKVCGAEAPCDNELCACCQPPEAPMERDEYEEWKDLRE